MGDRICRGAGGAEAEGNGRHAEAAAEAQGAAP